MSIQSFDQDALETELREDEGYKTFVYKDSLGFDTIGIGFLVDRRKGGLRPEEISFILKNRIGLAAQDMDRRIPWWRTLSPNRQRVLLNMAYQMGVDGLLGFVNTLRMVQNEDFAGAAEGMLNSLWAKQTPARAKRLSDRMKAG